MSQNKKLLKYNIGIKKRNIKCWFRLRWKSCKKCRAKKAIDEKVKFLTFVNVYKKFLVHTVTSFGWKFWHILRIFYVCIRIYFASFPALRRIYYVKKGQNRWTLYVRERGTVLSNRHASWLYHCKVKFYQQYSMLRFTRYNPRSPRTVQFVHIRVYDKNVFAIHTAPFKKNWRSF